MKNCIAFSTYALPSGYDQFLVISGSLSHIQRFIYNTSSQGALKNLRGRSFYLTLLARAIADTLLRRLDLGHDATLYNSGGTFCIVAPSTPERRAYLPGLVKEIKLSVSDLLHFDIVNLSVADASRQELEVECLAVFDKLFAQRHRAKFAPFGPEAAYEEVFGADNPHKYSSYEDIGSKLSDVTAILASSKRIESADSLLVEFEKLGLYYYLGKAEKLANIGVEWGYLLLINDADEPKRCSMPIYREFIAGNGTRANSFTNLFAADSSSHERLAVLRMDVDNLGAQLRSSMGKKDALAQYALFSHQLDAYFKEQVNKMWQDEFHDSTVIIYAGGDDLFIVGEWENTLKFMNKINTGFKTFFSEEAMSLSGGVSFIKPKYPIIRAAEMSADEESRAKQFEFNGKQKDAISIFNTPLRWEHEFKWVREYQKELLSLINGDLIDKSFTQHLLRIAENVSFVNGRVEPVRYIWLAAYDLSRMAKRKGDNEGSRFIKRCILDLMSGRTLNGNKIVSPYHSLQLITIAARLVEMKLWKTER